MAEYQSTNMADLVADIASHIKDEVRTSGKLPSVRKVSTEPLVNPAVFPFITVTPVNEIPNGNRGDKIYNIRRVRIEMVAKKNDSKSALRQTMGLAEQVKEIFKVNAKDYKVPDRQSKSVETVMDLDIVAYETSSNPAPFRNGFIHTSSIELEAHSFDPLYDNAYIDSTERHAHVVPTDTKTVMDKFTEMIKNARTGTPILTDVRSLKSFTLPPQPVYPVVFISMEDESRDHRFAGKDAVDRVIGVNVFTKVKSRKKSLDRNVDLANRLRQIVLSYPDVKGTCYDMQYVGTNFGQITAGADLLFGSQLLFNTSSFDGLPET